jgi:hypothetical protein
MALLLEHVQQQAQIATGNNPILLPREPASAATAGVAAAAPRPRPPVPPLIPLPPVAQQQQAAAASMTTVHAALRNTPNQPTFPTTLPDSMRMLLIQHKTFKLEQLGRTDRSHWQMRFAHALNRRKYLFSLVVRRASSLRGGESFDAKLAQAAIYYDNLRAGVSLPKFLVAMKRQDPNTKKRQSKNSGIGY